MTQDLIYEVFSIDRFLAALYKGIILPWYCEVFSPADAQMPLKSKTIEENNYYRNIGMGNKEPSIK